jgi:hypothetical protein
MHCSEARKLAMTLEADANFPLFGSPAAGKRGSLPVAWSWWFEEMVITRLQYEVQRWSGCSCIAKPCL